MSEQEQDINFENDLKKFIHAQARVLNTGLQANISKKEQGQLSKKIIAQMENKKLTEFTTADGTYYLFYPLPRMTFDMVQFKKDEPELYQKYLVSKEGKASLVFAPKNKEE